MTATKKFHAGDILEGYEGDGKSWANVTTLLLVYVQESNVAAIVLKSINPLTGEDLGRNGELGLWSLGCRDWKKVGEIPVVYIASHSIRQAVERWQGATA